MSAHTTIAWTDSTWNPVRGCTKVSAGCAHCYAQTFAERFRGVPGHPFEQGFDLRLVPDHLIDPFKWKEPRTIFVNSMSDLFHPGVPDAYLADVMDVMRRADWHIYQVLTKRPERMQAWLRAHAEDAALPHIWWGVTVENRASGLPRMERLREAPVARRFLSIEPLLEDLGPLDLTGFDWVIVGGESGPGARPMEAEWVRPLRDQCEVAGVPFFFKQWGGVRKKLTGRILDGRIHDEFPGGVSGAVPTDALRQARQRAFEAGRAWMPLSLVQAGDCQGVHRSTAAEEAAAV